MARHDQPAVTDTNYVPPAVLLADGPVEGALLPLVRINGELFVLDNCLHFFPAVSERSAGPQARQRLTV